MPNFTAQRKRVLKTTIDPQEVGHDLVLAALEQLIAKEKSESGAIRRLLYIGANAHFGLQVVDDAQREKVALTQQYPQRKRSRPLRASSAVKVKTGKSSSAAVQVAELPREEPAPAPKPLPAVVEVRREPESESRSEAPPIVQVEEPTPPRSSQAEIVVEPPAQQVPPVAAKPAAGGLMKLRHMALSQSVAPPEASAPRPKHISAEGQSSPAVQASALAKLKNDGREF